MGGCNNVHVTCATCDATLMVRTMMWGGVGVGGCSSKCDSKECGEICLSVAQQEPVYQEICKKKCVRLAGTQQIDRTWYQVKKSILKSLNNRKAGWLNETDIMRYVWVFVWRNRCHGDMYKCQGELCRKKR